MVDAFGFLAGSLVLATFCMQSMTQLRFVALLSNVAFVVYGIAAELLPVLVLHALLLPVNAYCLFMSRPADRCRTEVSGSEERRFVE